MGFEVPQASSKPAPRGEPQPGGLDARERMEFGPARTEGEAKRAPEFIHSDKLTAGDNSPNGAPMSHADQARDQAGASDSSDVGRRGRVELVAPSGLRAATGPADEEALLAAAIEILEKRAAASRHQAADVLAAVSKLTSACGSGQIPDSETFAGLAQKIDELETRLRAQSGVDRDDAFMKSALKAVEARLRIFSRSRSFPGLAETAEAPAGVAATAQSRPEQAAALEISEKAPFPFKSDLLARLDVSGAPAPDGSRALAPAASATAGESPRDIAELARKLDEMCRDGSPSHIRKGETTLEGERGADRSGVASEATISEPSDEPSSTETAPKPETPDAGEPLEQQPQLSAADDDGLSRSEAPALEAEPSEASVEDQGKSCADVAESAASQDIDNSTAAEFEGAGAVGSNAVQSSAGSDRNQFDALLAHIEETNNRFAARIDAGLAASSDETSALKDAIAGLTDEIAAVRRPAEANPAIEALEREMAKIAERLDGAGKAFAAIPSLEQSIAALFEQLEETRRSAAREFSASRTNASGARNATAPGGRSASDEIAELRESQEAAGRRIDLTMTALRETVDKVADRLVKVETDVDKMRPTRLGPFLPQNLTPILAPRTDRRTETPEQAQNGASIRRFSGGPVGPIDKSSESTSGLDDKSLDGPDALLEPGSGSPQNRSKNDSRDVGSQPAVSLDLERAAGRADFIAAARRAAQAAEQGPRESIHPFPNVTGTGETGGPARALRRARNFLGVHRRAIFLVLASLLIAAASYALARKVARERAIYDVSPALLKQLEKTFAHGARNPAPAEDAAASQGAARPVSAPQPPAAPETVDQPGLGSPNEPAEPIEAPGLRPIAGSAPIVTDALAAAGNSGQTAAAPIGAPPSAPASTPQERANGDPRAKAEAGDAAAQFALGLRFAEGRDRPRDFKLAAQWLEKSASQGFAKAQYRLATLYERGLGTPRDIRRAIGLYLAAAEQGNARAMHNLGVLAADPPDGRPDYATAALWFQKAAEYGVRDSQFNLAVLSARGLGVPRDPVKAYAWFAIVAAQGDGEAARKRDEVGARLAGADLVAAKTTAEAFQPRQPDQAANEALNRRLAADSGESASPEPAVKPEVSGLQWGSETR